MAKRSRLLVVLPSKDVAVFSGIKYKDFALGTRLLTLYELCDRLQLEQTTYQQFEKRLERIDESHLADIIPFCKNRMSEIEKLILKIDKHLEDFVTSPENL